MKKAPASFLSTDYLLYNIRNVGFSRGQQCQHCQQFRGDTFQQFNYQQPKQLSAHRDGFVEK